MQEFTNISVLKWKTRFSEITFNNLMRFVLSKSSPSIITNTFHLQRWINFFFFPILSLNINGPNSVPSLFLNWILSMFAFEFLLKVFDLFQVDKHVFIKTPNVYLSETDWKLQTNKEQKTKCEYRHILLFHHFYFGKWFNFDFHTFTKVQNFLKICQ